MSGVVAGLIGSVKSAPSGPVNLVSNPSFTTNTNGWSIGGLGDRTTSVFKSAPASLRAQGISDFIPASASTSLVLTIGQVYSASFWIYGSGNTVNCNFTCGTTTSSLAQIVPLTGNFINYKIENVLCTGNTFGELSFTDSTEDPVFYLDNVSVVLGATALVL